MSAYAIVRSYNGLHLYCVSPNQHNIIVGLHMRLLTIYELPEPEQSTVAPEDILYSSGGSLGSC